MTKVIIWGAWGKMGQEVIKAIEEKKDEYTIAYLVDQNKVNNKDILIPNDILNKNNLDFDGIIDFSSDSGTTLALDLAFKNRKPIVIGTTALKEETINKAKEYSKNIPILIASNFSLGIATIKELLPKFTEILKDYDIEIIEEHHRYKKDAPSGTAFSLFESIAKSYNKDFKYNKNNSNYLEIPIIENKKIKIHAIRSGDIIGEHEIIFANNNEVVRIKHSAISRRVFAFGALKALNFLINKPPKLYEMKDIITN